MKKTSYQVFQTLYNDTEEHGPAVYTTHTGDFINNMDKRSIVIRCVIFRFILNVNKQGYDASDVRSVKSMLGL